MRVAYQAGVLAALEEAGLRFHHVDGASGGTMNLSMLLSGQDSQEIGDRWRSLDQRQFATAAPWPSYLRSWRWPGLAGSRGLRENVFPQLGIDPAVIRSAKGIIGTYNVADFATKSAQVIEHSDVDLDLLVAAISLPVLMPAVTRSGTAYTDAVWIRDSNVVEAVRRGSDEVWLVWCIGNTPAYHRGSFHQYVHMIEMAATGSLLQDLAYVAARWPDRPVRLHVIKPYYPLPLDPSYYLGRIDAATLIALGYQDASRYLDHPTPRSAPWLPEVTAMSEASPGAAARLVMTGSFTCRRSEAGTGGGTPGSGSGPVSLRLEVQTGRGPARHGEGDGDGDASSVSGYVSLPGGVPAVLVEQGAATLDPERGLRFRLRWGSRSTPRLLTAEQSGLHRALDLTLYAGRDDAGEVLGTGTVALDWRQAARALASVRATDTTTSSEAAGKRGGLARALLRSAVMSSPISRTGQGA